MSDYFDSSVNRVPIGSLARSTQVNTLRDEVGVGFDLFPDEVDIKTGKITYGVDSGVANAYEITMDYPVAAYVEGMEVVFSPTNDNTGPTTINVDGLGAIGVKRPDDTDLQLGDIVVGNTVALRYNGSTFRFTGGAPASSFASAAQSAADAQAAQVAAELAETNAKASETSASTSASSASTSAATATTKAGEASTSASNAATSETNAASSASAAATSETNAATSEINAASSASAAATSETNTATSETNAASSASAASTSESNAAQSELDAEDSNLEAESWANESEDVPVNEYAAGVPSARSPIVYSAKHYWAKITAAVALFVQRTSATGSAVLPTGTTAQRDGTPLEGYIRRNSDLQQVEVYSGSAWEPVGAGASGAAGNPVFYENDTSVTADYTITSGKNAMSAGPITIDTGVTVTVPTGSVWAIV